MFLSKYWQNSDFLVNYPFKTLKDVLYGEYLMLSCLNIAQSVAKTLKFSPSSKLQRCNPFRLSQTCMFVAFFRPYHVARLLSVCSLIMCPIFFFGFEVEVYFQNERLQMRWLASLFCIWSHRTRSAYRAVNSIKYCSFWSRKSHNTPDLSLVM